MTETDLVAVPSGMDVSFVDVVANAPGPDGVVVRFRFLAPAIVDADAVPFETAAADMQFLCERYALPKVADNVPAPTQIIVSLSDRPVTFGEAAPDAVQYFEAYSIVDGVCVWNAF